ncbi:eukaryotic translation initiation factor eIF-1 [Fusarium acutatum]|uniref:Eukaryotic translation initiation factor eIF-1 n=1 Tax=Fusarium acutatum TaxID=78861 RepID=A0A8H4NK08_9HYPO|nr:eukaryotic translation initiation factor eIF-1 [Fusarium acutatum]
MCQHTSQSASTPVLPPASHQSPKPTYSSLPLPLLPNSPDSLFSLTTSPTQIPANSKDFAASQTSSLDILIAYTHYSISTQRGAILPAVAENILFPLTKPISQGNPSTSEFMSIENLKTYDPFAEADEDTGETKQTQNYIHIRIQRGFVFAYNANMAPERNGRKTLTTVQGLPKKFDQKKILKVIKKKFACNGTIVNDSEMGEVIQLQGDQRKDVQEFLIDKKEGLELDAKTIKVHGF